MHDAVVDQRILFVVESFTDALICAAFSRIGKPFLLASTERHDDPVLRFSRVRAVSDIE